MAALLDVKNLGISFGGLRAVNGFDISIEQGELYGLIGPNGAGKQPYLTSLPECINRIPGKLYLTAGILPEKRQLISARRELPELFRISAFSNSSAFWTM